MKSATVLIVSLEAVETALYQKCFVTTDLTCTIGLIIT